MTIVMTIISNMTRKARIEKFEKRKTITVFGLVFRQDGHHFKKLKITSTGWTQAKTKRMDTSLQG